MRFSSNSSSVISILGARANWFCLLGAFELLLIKAENPAHWFYKLIMPILKHIFVSASVKMKLQ